MRGEGIRRLLNVVLNFKILTICRKVIIFFFILISSGNVKMLTTRGIRGGDFFAK